MKLEKWSVNKEITGVSTLGFKDAAWMSTSLLLEEIIRRLLRLRALCEKNGT